MKAIKLLILFLLTLFLVNCNSDKIKGNGKIETKTTNLSYIDFVSVSGGYKVNILSGQNKQYFEVKTDENLFEYIITEVNGNKLSIKNKNNIKLKPSKDLIVNIFTNNISKIDTSGAVELKIDNIDNKYLDIDSSGAVEAVISGKTESFNLDSSGASEINAKNLISKNVIIDGSGAVDIQVHATDTLDIDISGAGNVTYYGSPKVTQDISGAAKILQK